MLDAENAVMESKLVKNCIEKVENCVSNAQHACEPVTAPGTDKRQAKDGKGLAAKT